MPENFDVYIPTSEPDRSYIHSIWRMQNTDSRNIQGIIMPNGTAEIIFNFSDPIKYTLDATSTKTVLPSIFLGGVRFNPIRNEIRGKEYLIGMQFNSIALKIMYGYSVKEFTNKIYDGLLIDTSLNQLAEQLYNQNEFKLQAETLVSWFRKKVQKNGCLLSMSKLQQIVHRQKGLDLTVKKLSSEILLSTRQLQRNANEWLGMGPDEYLLYHKFLYSVSLIQQERLSLTEVALKSCYYDQPHFIKEFKQYAGMTPGQYRAILFSGKSEMC